jgi:hypothetical protein
MTDSIAMARSYAVRRLGSVLVTAALFLALSTSAQADDQGVPPPPSDPLAAQRSATKVAQIEAASAAYSGNAIFTAITGKQRVEINADSFGSDYAGLDMQLWQEPQDGTYARNPHNWCGPGSTAGVVSRWSYMYRGIDEVANYPGGSLAYQNHLSSDLNEMVQVCWDENAQAYVYCTTWDGMTQVTNSAAQAGNFYLRSGPIASLSEYTNYLKLDLHDMMVPLIPVVMTTHLDGWGGWSVQHWVTVKQYWSGGNTTTYGDTAGYYQRAFNYPNGPYGWYTTGIDWFYNQVQLAYNEIVW